VRIAKPGIKMQQCLILVLVVSVLAVWVRLQPPIAKIQAELQKIAVNGIPLTSDREKAKEMLKAPEFRLEVDEPGRLVALVVGEYRRLVQLEFRGGRLVKATGSSLTLESRHIDIHSAREEVIQVLGAPDRVVSERAFLELVPYTELYFSPSGLSELVIVYQGEKLVNLTVTL
jgi:hypothetical protein